MTADVLWINQIMTADVLWIYQIMTVDVLWIYQIMTADVLPTSVSPDFSLQIGMAQSQYLSSYLQQCFMINDTSEP